MNYAIAAALLAADYKAGLFSAARYRELIDKLNREYARQTLDKRK